MAARSIAFVVVVYFLLAAAPVEARTGVLNHDGHARSVELSMCDTQQPDDTLLSIHSELSAQGKLRKVKPRDARAYTVNTYFHFVVTADTAALYPPEKRDQLATAQVSSAITPGIHSSPLWATLFISFNLMSSTCIPVTNPHIPDSSKPSIPPTPLQTSPSALPLHQPSLSTPPGQPTKTTSP